MKYSVLAHLQMSDLIPQKHMLKIEDTMDGKKIIIDLDSKLHKLQY